jgi:hypothetical protein
MQLPRPLPPGAFETLTVPIRAPHERGLYELRVSLVQEYVAWFDDVDEASGLRRKVNVRPPLSLPFISRDHLVASFPPTQIAWRGDYGRRHQALVSAAIEDERLLQRFREGRRLPNGYGYGFDERVVEYPWLFAQELIAPLLDAGSTLNHRHVLERLGGLTNELTIVTLAPEPESFAELGATYVYEDLRRLPFASESFRTIVCLSTLEHVGMDNTRFGASEPRSADPYAERDRAVAELRRVAAPGATILISVPFGEPQDIGWQLQFDADALARVREHLMPSEWYAEFFAYTEAGWQRSDLEHVAGARFEDHSQQPHRASDAAAAARAVTCVRARV